MDANYLRDVAWRSYHRYQAVLQHAIRWESRYKLHEYEAVDNKGFDPGNPWGTQLFPAWLAYQNAKHEWRKEMAKDG